MQKLMQHTSDYVEKFYLIYKKESFLVVISLLKTGLKFELN